MADKETQPAAIAVNRKATHDFHIHERMEAGIVLVGQGPADNILLGTGRHRLVAYVAIGEALTNLVMSVILVRYYGILGVANGLVDKRGGHGRIHPAGQPADHGPVAGLGLDRGDLVIDDVAHGPGRFDPGHVVKEALEHALGTSAHFVRAEATNARLQYQYRP